MWIETAAISVPAVDRRLYTVVAESPRSLSDPTVKDPPPPAVTECLEHVHRPWHGSQAPASNNQHPTSVSKRPDRPLHGRAWGWYGGEAPVRDGSKTRAKLPYTVESSSLEVTVAVVGSV